MPGRRLYENGPSMSDDNKDMGGKDFGVANASSWGRHRGIDPKHIPDKVKAAEVMRKKHPKRV